MGREVSADLLLLGRGKVYFDRLDSAGAPTGELFLGNTPTFEITPTPEEIKKYSSATRAADLIASDVIRNALTIRIAGDEFSKENLAMALFGDVSTLSQTGSTVTDELITSVLHDRFYATEYRDLSSVVVTGPSGTPLYDVTDDYIVDAVSGRIYIVPGGAITEGTNIEVDYAYGTIAYNRVRGMNVSSVRGLIRFVGDPARGTKFEARIWRASVRADGAIGFISDEYASWTLAGDIESDAVNHPDEPHFDIIELPAS